MTRYCIKERQAGQLAFLIVVDKNLQNVLHEGGSFFFSLRDADEERDTKW